MRRSFIEKVLLRPYLMGEGDAPRLRDEITAPTEVPKIQRRRQRVAGPAGG